MARILVIEDEKDISGLIRYNLEKEGHHIAVSHNGEDGLAQARVFKPELVVLDLMLPGMQGLDVLRRMKGDDRLKHAPVIIVSAKASETDRIIGLEIGADDYVMKPFSVKELASRVKAVLRRGAAPETGPKLFTCKGLAIDFDSVSVRLNGKPVHLSPYEFKILGFLALHPGRAWSREDLLANVWKDDAFVQPRTVDVHIRRLRTLIEKDPKKPFFIQTVRGFGYIFGAEA